MPKRVVDGEAIYGSEKLAAIRELWMRAEYANLLPLALANGSFECTPRLVWSKAYAYNRPEVTLEMVERLLDELCRVKMLFRFKDAGKIWGYWVGIDKPGRLPNEARRKSKHEKRGADVPQQALNEFVANTRPMADHSPSTTQPVDDHGPTNGDIGFGFGFCFGSCSGTGIGNGNGENLLSEQKDCSDVEKDSSRSASREGVKLAELLKSLILANNPQHKVIDNRQLQKWAIEADRMVRIDKRTAADIEAVIRWTQADSFWLKNVLSMATLRKQFDQLVMHMRDKRFPKKANGGIPLMSIDHSAGHEKRTDGSIKF